MSNPDFAKRLLWRYGWYRRLDDTDVPMPRVQARVSLLQVLLMCDVFGLAGIAAESHCLAQSAGGYLCSEAPSHDGWHRAEVDGDLLDTWPWVGVSGD
jgi:hypothetical protein